MENIEFEQDEEAQFEPLNQDTLGRGFFLSVGEPDAGGGGSGSTCLTPVSFGMDLNLSMVANKGSMSLSMDVSAAPLIIVTAMMVIDTISGLRR